MIMTYDAIKIEQLKKFLEYVKTLPSNDPTEKLIQRVSQQIEFLENQENSPRDNRPVV